MTRLLLDQGLAPLAAAILRQDGWDAVHVMELGLQEADDSVIMEYALRHSMVCITLDHDFHSHLARTAAGGPSVVFLRIAGRKAAQQAELLKAIWRQCGEAIEAGAAVSADGEIVRLRRLPLK